MSDVYIAIAHLLFLFMCFVVLPSLHVLRSINDIIQWSWCIASLPNIISIRQYFINPQRMREEFSSWSVCVCVSVCLVEISFHACLHRPMLVPTINIHVRV